MTGSNPTVVVTRQEEGRMLNIGSIKMKILEDGRLNSDRVSIVEGILPPHQKGPPEHFHNMHDETFYITKGTVRFSNSDGHFDLKVGDFISVPIHAPHTFENATDEEARFVSTMTPAFYVHYLELLSEMVEEGTMFAPAQIEEVMARYATFHASKLKEQRLQ